MRISELSRVAGVPVATIKYYQREGLLFPGKATAPNQADYSDAHVHRLRVVKALTDVRGLAIAQVRRVVGAIDDEDMPMHHMLGIAQYALGPPEDHSPVPADVSAARTDVDRFLTDRGWRIHPAAPGRRALADALVALRGLGRDANAEVFAPYAEAAERVTQREIADAEEGASRADVVEAMVVGTVVFEAALATLRRLAHEHYSSIRLEGVSSSRQRSGRPSSSLHNEDYGR